jgi:hypothetical protein
LQLFFISHGAKLVQSHTFARKIPTLVATVLHKKVYNTGSGLFQSWVGGGKMTSARPDRAGSVTGKDMRVLRLFCRKYVSIILPGPDVTYEPGRNGFNGYIQLVLRSKSGRLVIKLFIG